MFGIPGIINCQTVKLAVRFCKDTRGATVVEYGLIGGAIGIALLTGLLLVGGQLNDDVYSAIVNAMSSALPGSGSSE